MRTAHDQRGTLMEVTLERVDEADDPEIIVGNSDLSVAKPEFVIGRAGDCHLQLESDFVSRHHCELILDERHHALRVRDLGSRNGTFVNDDAVADERELTDGDLLTVACIPFEVHIR